MAIQDGPGEEPGDQRAAHTHKGGPVEANRVGTGNQQRCQPAHDEAENEHDDEVGQNGHACIVRRGGDVRSAARRFRRGGRGLDRIRELVLELGGLAERGSSGHTQ